MTILLSQSPKGWDYRDVPLCLAIWFFCICWVFDFFIHSRHQSSTWRVTSNDLIPSCRPPLHSVGCFPCSIETFYFYLFSFVDSYYFLCYWSHIRKPLFVLTASSVAPMFSFSSFKVWGLYFFKLCVTRDLPHILHTELYLQLLRLDLNLLSFCLSLHSAG